MEGGLNGRSGNMGGAIIIWQRRNLPFDQSHQILLVYDQQNSHAIDLKPIAVIILMAFEHLRNG